MSSKPFLHHAVVLVLCSAVSFVGHYLQFGVARFTPWIPATAGCTLLALHRAQRSWPRVRWALPAVTALFGLLTLCMVVRFWPQAHQPLRKKLVFTTMSLSAVVCLTRAGLTVRAGPTGAPPR